MKPARQILPLALLLVANLLSVKTAHAQSIMGLSAIPPRLEITGKPGDVVVREIKVRNESKIVRYMTTDIKDFIVLDDKGTPTQIGENLDQSQNRWAASNWVTASPHQFRLEPGETKSMMVTIIVPDNALPGGHYAMIIHTPSQETVLSESGASMQAQVGTLLYITVPGQINQNAQVKEFTAPKFLEYGPVNFKSVITNLSDIHIAPMGSIVVTNWMNGKTASLPLDTTNIFPFVSREFNNVLDKKFLFGRYKAQLLAAYGTSGNTFAATVFFWVIPWRLIILIITAIVIVGILISLLRQNAKTDANSGEKINELEHELDELKKKYRDRK